MAISLKKPDTESTVREFTLNHLITEDEAIAMYSVAKTNITNSEANIQQNILISSKQVEVINDLVVDTSSEIDESYKFDIMNKALHRMQIKSICHTAISIGLIVGMLISEIILVVAMISSKTSLFMTLATKYSFFATIEESAVALIAVCLIPILFISFAIHLGRQ